MIAQRRATFDTERRHMLAALSSWIASGGDPRELLDEAEATARAMRQMIEMRRDFEARTRRAAE